MTVEWLAERDEPGWHTTLLIEHGLIVEQWTDDIEPAEVEQAPAELHVSTTGPVPGDAPDSFRQHLGAVLDTIDDPVLFVRGKIDLATDPAVAQPARAAITVDVNGSVIRAHGRGASLQEADHGGDPPSPRPASNTARTGSVTARRACRLTLVTGTTGICRRCIRLGSTARPVNAKWSRHKTPAPVELTIDEAAWDMHMLDYDFFIFRELGSGRDTLLWLAPAGLCLQQVGRVADELDLGVTDAKVDSTAAARLSVREAIERLEAIGEQFVFFENATTGRGNVLYHRYDGHYGVITPRDWPKPRD